jgi:uncharacterized protein (TIGR02391 family)
MKNFPPREILLQMEPEDLGGHLLGYFLKPFPGAQLNRFNFMLTVSRDLTEHFMEAWCWLEREGFIAPTANDMHGLSYFVTRAGRRVAAAEDLDAWKLGRMFPEGVDDALVQYVKPLFLRGDYDTAVFRAFKEVETRVRKKSGLTSEYGRSLMLKAFGETGPLMMGHKDDRSAARELFAGAISFCKNPSSHHEVQFEDPREVADLISFANQLLRIVGRI